MEWFAEAVSVVGALLLSVSCGLLFEELLFGGLVRLFFSQTAPGARTERNPLNTPTPAVLEGERKCSR